MKLYIQGTGVGSLGEHESLLPEFFHKTCEMHNNQKISLLKGFNSHFDQVQNIFCFCSVLFGFPGYLFITLRAVGCTVVKSYLLVLLPLQLSYVHWLFSSICLLINTWFIARSKREVGTSHRL